MHEIFFKSQKLSKLLYIFQNESFENDQFFYSVMMKHIYFEMKLVLLGASHFCSESVEIFD